MMTNQGKIIILIFTVTLVSDAVKTFSKHELNMYKQRVAHMFEHAYNGYLKYAFPYDELRPITCDGHDTWGSYSLTLVDALDTLAVMGNYTEFRRVANLLINSLNFDKDINVSVFETNIRIVGGLISAHLLSKRAGMTLEEGWPCSGPLLRLAEKVARKLLPAFDTETGMPYGTVNLLYGVPKGETPITCTSGVTTFIVEFGALSRLTGDSVFEKTAMKALTAMWQHNSEIGLVGNHIDVKTGKWTALDSGIGAGVDSYFEYLVKGSILFQKPELMEMFRGYEKAIEKYMKKEDWYMWTHMQKGTVTLPVFQSLEAFWPGLQSLIGDVENAMKSLHNYHQVWTQYGFTPEFYNIPSGATQSGREGYPLRPELIESLMYLYKATHDPTVIQMGIDILESIEHNAKTRCGYATVKDVRDHRLENRMESFFLAETTKYLYLLFDQDNFIHNTGDHGTLIQTTSGSCIIDAGGYVFNTEAHPIDPAALYCCSAEKHQHDIDLLNLHDNIDLLTIFDLNDKKDDIFEETGKQMDKLLKSSEESVYKSIFKTTKEVIIEDNSKTKNTENILNINVGGKPGSDIKVTGSTLQDVVNLLHDTANKQTKTLTETLSETIEMLNKLTGKDSDKVSPTAPLSVIIPSTQGTPAPSAVASTEIRLDSTKVLDDVSGINVNSDKTSNSDNVNSESESNGNSNKDRKYQYKIDTSPTRLFMCPAKPFHSRFSVMGEMFVQK